MRKRTDLIAARLTVLLLTLVIITGSFSSFVFADGSTDESVAGNVKEASTEEKGSSPVTDSAGKDNKAPEKKEAEAEKEPPASDNKSSEDAGTKPAADAEKPSGKDMQAADKADEEQQSAEGNETASAVEKASTDGQPESAAAEPEADLPELVMGEPKEAKNEGSSENTDAAKTVKVSYSGGPNGTVSAELRNGDSVTSLKSGDTVDLTANANGTIYFTGQPDAGYVVRQFSITNGSQTSVIPGERFRPGSANQLSVKVSAITGDLSFAAEFEVKKYKVELTPDDESEGSVAVDKSKAAEGETVTVKVVPAKGYRISEVLYKYQQDDGWYKFVDIEGDPATGTYSFRMPAKDIYVEASFFKPLTVKIKESKGGSVTLKDRETGKVIKSGDEVKPYQSIIVEAKPKSGYSFDKWEFTSADGGNVSFFKRDSYFRMRYADVTVEAIFTRNSSSGSGSGSTSYTPSSNSYYYEDVEEPEEPAAEELTAEDLTEEEQEMLDVTPLVSRVVAETVMTATVSMAALIR